MASGKLIEAGIRLAIESREARRELAAIKKDFAALGDEASEAAKADRAAIVERLRANQARREGIAAEIATLRELSLGTKQAAAEKRELDRAEADRAKLRRRDEVRAEREAAAARLASAKLARQEQAKAAQLAPQVTDIVTGLAGGQNPLLVAIQQGGQLRDIYGGVGNAAKALLGLFTPLRVVVGGLAGAIGALGLAAYQGQRNTLELNRTLAVTGNVAGLSASRINALAKEIASQQDLSVSSVRDVLRDLLKTGDYTADTLKSAALAVTTFSKASGISAEEALKQFDDMGKGVTAWAEKTNKSYNFLSVAELERIRSLQNSGRVQEAMRIALQRFAEEMQSRYIPDTNAFARAWDRVARSISDAWDRLGSGSDDRVTRLRKELETLERLIAKRKEGGGLALEEPGAAARDEARARALRDLLDEETRRETQRDAARYGAAARQRQVQDDSQSIAKFKQDYKTRQAVAEEFARQRATFEEAIDRQIAAAKLEGNRELERQLTRDKSALLAQQRASELERLRSFDRDSTASRVAQVREQYDKEADLLKGWLERRKQANEQAFADGLRDTQTYISNRARLESQETDAAIAELQRKISAQRDVLAVNQSRQGAARGANEREQFDEANRRTLEDIARLEAQLVNLERQSVSQAEERVRVERQLQDELRNTLRDVEAQTRALQGTETDADIEAGVRARFQGLLDRVRQLGGDVSAVNRLMEATVSSEKFGKAQRDLGRLTEALALFEQQADRLAEQGAITTEQAEQRKFDAREKAIPQLRELLELLGRLAQNPDEKLIVDRGREEVDSLQKQATLIRQALRTAVSDGASQALQDFVTGVKSAKEAALDFLASIVKAMLNVITRRLGEQLANSMFPAPGAGGGGTFLESVGTFLTSLFHGGGVVGGMQRMSRALSPMLFATAARYHSGGLAGLAPDEVPAVLQKGEEVLTESDPRHRKNLGGSTFGDINVHVSIGEAGGNDADMAAASGRLGRVIRAAIDDWAATEARPGGILARG